MKLSPRIRTLRATLAVAAVPLLGLLASCAGKDPKSGAGIPPAPVVMSAAVSKDVPITVQAIGSVVPYNSVAVRARVGGELTRVALTEGADVRDGDVLFTIDPRPYQAALQAAVADSARDAARAASAAADLARYADLIQKDYITQQQYDQAVADAAAAKSTLEADKAAAESARLNLNYCTIRAPISGRAGDLLVRQGNLVTANDAQPLVVLDRITPIYVSFSVPEANLSEIRRYAGQGQLPVTATMPSTPGSAYKGLLTFIDNAVDEGTGTILLKATFPNEDRALWPGQFVDVAIELTTMPGAIVVPATAVQTGQQGDYLYVVKQDMTAQMQSITVGPKFENDVVIEKGVEAGENVITDGQLRVVPGGKVVAKNEAEQKGPSPR